MSRIQLGAVAFGLLVLSAAPARAVITVTNDTSATSLAVALQANGTGGIFITSSTLSGHTSGAAASSGTFDATIGANAYGLAGKGIVISSGNAADYSTGPNTSSANTTSYGPAGTAAQEAILDPITGSFTHFDVTEFTITFDVDASTSAVFFNVVFGSEEFDEFVGSSFIDGFGLLLNGTNIAFVGGSPVNINHPNMTFIAETELDGVLAPGGLALLTFSGAVTPGSTENTLKFIISDTSDRVLDTTAYISGLGNRDPVTGNVPEPASLAIWGGIGIAGLVAAYRRKRAKAA